MRTRFLRRDHFQSCRFHPAVDGGKTHSLHPGQQQGGHGDHQCRCHAPAGYFHQPAFQRREIYPEIRGDYHDGRMREAGERPCTRPDHHTGQRLRHEPRVHSEGF